MKEKFYIILIMALTALSVFLFMTHRRDCRLRESGMECAAAGSMGQHGRGMGMGMGMQSQAARDTLFSLIKAGSSDTALLFSKLEGIVSVQRENQKAAIRRILSLRDSLTGEERELFLRQIDDRFCSQQGMHGKGHRMGRQ